MTGPSRSSRLSRLSRLPGTTPRRAPGVVVVAVALLCGCTAAPSVVPAGSGAPSAPTAPTAPTTPSAPSAAPSPRPSVTTPPSTGPRSSPSPPPSLSPGATGTPGTTSSPDLRPFPSPSVEVLFEAAAGPPLRAADGPAAGALEPVVAAHPTDPAVLALAYARARTPVGDSIGISAGVRISRDGGRTWSETRRHPWDGSGRSPSLHSAVAWGPGADGTARLWWAGTTFVAGGGVRVGVGWSDDLGATWSRLHVARDTTAWIGGFPDITADHDPASPGFGNVYVVYSHPAGRGRGVGTRLLATGDGGRTWHATDVERAPSPAGFPVSWRFGSRVRTGPDGTVHVSTWQADLRRWDSADPFDRGRAGNVGRVGFAVARLTFDRATGRFAAGTTVLAITLTANAFTMYRQVAPGTRSHTYLDPMWSHGLDVDPRTARVYLAVGDVTARPRGGDGRGSVRVGRSDDGGRTWAWTTLPPAPAVEGVRQSSFRPTLAVSGGVVFVGLHTIDDVPAKGAWAADARIGTAWTASTDGGRTFSTPSPIVDARWRASALERAYNGPGLRDRADVTADGRVVYAYADARTAPARPARATGQRQVHVVILLIERRPRAPSPAGHGP